MAISAPSMSLRGYLVHPDGTGISKRKIHLLSEKGWFWNPTVIAETRTESSGKFRFDLPVNSDKTEREKRAVIAVFEPKTKREGSGERRVGTLNVIYPTQSSCTLETQAVELYEYEEGLPIQKLPSNPEFTPQQAGASFYAELLQSALIPKVKQFLSKAAGLSTETVQSLYPNNNKVLCSEQVIDLILNGVNPMLFRKGPNGTLIGNISWEGIEHDDGADLFDTEISLSLNKSGVLVDNYISITYPNQPKEIKYKGDPDYDRFLQLFASMAITWGEIGPHLGDHIYTGYISIAFFRCISPENPLFRLLAPHLMGVQDINKLGAGLIFGPSGVLNVSGVSPNGITQGLQKTLAAMDYATFSPRNPINDQHTYARAGQLYWNKVVVPAVDQFFKENPELMREWKEEITAMSNCLLSASVPREAPKGSKEEWVDTNELNFNDGEFSIYKGVLKSFKPIVGPDRLKQFCNHVIYHATYAHSAVHNRQSIDLTNLNIATLAPQNHALDEEGHWEPFANTPPAKAGKQLAVAGALTNYVGDKVVSSEQDVYPPLVKNLKAQKKNFDKIGYDIREIMTCIEI